MSAVIPFLEARPDERKQNADVLNGLRAEVESMRVADDFPLGLGGTKAKKSKKKHEKQLTLDADGRVVDPLAKPHTELMRLLWARARIAQALVGAQFKLEVQGGDIMVVIEPAVRKDVIPWHHSGSPSRRFNLFSTNSKMNCVAAGTPIVTNRGVLPIEDVCVGDKVLTREGFKLVTAAQQTGVRPTLKLTTNMGHEVRVTPDHLILAKKSWPTGEKPNPTFRGELSWHKAGDLQPDMFVCPAPEGYDAGLKRCTGDWELGLLLGYACGDGTFAANGRIAIDVGDVKLADLQVLAEVAQRRFGAEPHWGEYLASRKINSTEDDLVQPAEDGEESTIWRLYWEHAGLTEFFKTNGFTQGVYSSMRKVPAQVLTGSRDMMQGFLSGLISTDGSVTITPQGRVQAELTTTSRLLALGVQQLFTVLGGRVGINSREHWVKGRQYNDEHRVQINTAAALDILRDARVVNIVKGSRLGEVQRQKPRNMITRIASIENDGLQVPVYDLSIEGLPEFTAGGLIVHNCPTFDLPAGVQELGGSCPGAAFAQSSVSQEMLKSNTTPGVNYGHVEEPGKVAFLVSEVAKDWEKAGEPAPDGLNLMTTVCEYCVAGDTLVMVRGRGLMAIEDVVGLGDVEVWSGSGWRVTHAVMMKLDRTVEVQFAGGRKLRCTPDHGIITTDGEVQAQHLIAGEHQINPVLPSENPFPAAAALPPCELGEQHFNEKRGVLPTTWSRELGVWLGYLLGDGWFTEQYKFPTLGICSAVGDMNDLERLADITESWAGGRPEVGVYHAAPAVGLVPTPDGGDVARVYWRLKGMVAFAKSLGVSKKGEISVPAAIWSASADGVAGFLSGLFSTDGSVARWPSRVAVSFANTSRRLCEEVQQLLFAFGIRSNICEYTSNAKRGYKQMWKVDIVAAESVQRFAQRVGFFNERKAESLKAGLVAMGEVKSQVKRISVTAVIPGHDLEPVYDLINVGEEHQFIANGIPVSNCYATGSKYAEAVVQFAEIARLAFVKTLMSTAEGTETLIRLLVRTIEDTLVFNATDMARHGIRPIRVHSSGDFFSPAYADMWLEVARRLHQNTKKAKEAGIKYTPVMLWAPTRTHVLKGFNAFWQKRLNAHLIPPNFSIRPSAYSVGDPAPYTNRPSPTGTKGTAVLFPDDAKRRIHKEGRAEFGDGKKLDFQCGVYALEKGNKTCLSSIAPDGRTGCRACWKRRDLAIGYVIH